METYNSLIVKSFQELSTAELYEILKARFAVFVMEQHCFYLDMDDIDYRCLHIALWRGNEVIAYARLFAEDELGIWHVGRMLTRERKKGLGKLVMQEVMRQAALRGAVCLRMEAQTHAVGFYQKLGFQTVGTEFMEAGIPHIRMEKIIKE